MAEGLILEFDGLDEGMYNTVNGNLGIDPGSGEGDWPAGMLFHAGGTKPGGLVVFEVWESKEDQAAFMNGRLGPALQQAGVTAPPTRVEWLGLVAHRNLEG
jgi:hypothetical protein